jgi:hypothetical protein
MHSVDQTLRVTRKKVPVPSMHHISIITQLINVSMGSCYAPKNTYRIWTVKYIGNNMTVKHNKFVKPNYGMPLCKFRWTTCFGHDDHMNDRNM